MAKKKAKSTRRTSSGAEAQERRLQRLDARRLAREQALAARLRAERRARLVRMGGMVMIGGALVALFLFLTRPESTPDQIGGHPIQKLGESGSGDHVSGTVDYDSTPPVHGPHDPNSAPCGVHGEPIPNERQVHSLEHGAVGIQYLPDADPEDIARIEDIARGFDSGVFSAPHPGMESNFAVTSWGELMELNTLDVDAIDRYIAAFRGNGPEDVTCENTVDEPFGAGDQD
ncbi:MAG: DUF3105 domain-containing protein [Actinomycetota bacterium]